VIKVSAIMLAAGMSKRMGKDKLLFEYLGKPLLQHSVDLLSDLPVYERILITSDARLAFISLSPGIRICINPHPEKGLSKSIQTGTQAASGTHYLFLTADQPKLTKADLLQLLDAADADPGKIIYPCIDSNPNSPTLFPAVFRPELLDLYRTDQSGKENDNGGRTIRDANKQHCLVIEPENPENFADIDNMDDYEQLLQEQE